METDQPPTTFDNKPICLSSPRPLNPKTYTNWTGASDDLFADEIETGDLLALDIPQGQYYSAKSIRFSSDGLVAIRRGIIGWEAAGWSTTINARLVASATQVIDSTASPTLIVDDYFRIHEDTTAGDKIFASMPVPVPIRFDVIGNSQGFWELDQNYNLTYKPNGDGAYNLYCVDTPVAYFLKNFLIYGTNYQFLFLESDDIEILAPGYYFQIEVLNAQLKKMRAWSNLNLYRERIL